MKIDPSTELFINKNNQTEREVSDKRYASKVVEKIVFSAMGLFSTGIIGAILKLILK